MSDDIDFISNVKALADNGTLTELLTRIEKVRTDDWKIEQDPVKRDRCWHVIQAIEDLRSTIKGLTKDETVQAFNTRYRRAS